MTIKLQMILPSTSGNPEDAATNTWYANPVGATSVTTAAESFKEAVRAVYGTLDEYLSASVDGAKVNWKGYDLQHTPPRVPIIQGTVPASLIVGTTRAPRELSICFSFKGAFASGTPNARRRGRVYFGPLAGGSTVVDTSSGRPNTAFRTACQGALQTLIDASQASTEYTWVVRSATSGNTVAVTDGWVDDEWDIQRRRGLRPTTRSTFA